MINRHHLNHYGDFDDDVIVVGEPDPQKMISP